MENVGSTNINNLDNDFDKDKKEHKSIEKEFTIQEVTDQKLKQPKLTKFTCIEDVTIPENSAFEECDSVKKDVQTTTLIRSLNQEP